MSTHGKSRDQLRRAAWWAVKVAQTKLREYLRYEEAYQGKAPWPDDACDARGVLLSIEDYTHRFGADAFARAGGRD